MTSESIATQAGSVTRAWSEPAKRKFSLVNYLKKAWIFRKKYKAYLLNVVPSKGHCYMVQVPDYLTSDKDGVSKLMIFENSIPLKHPHAIHSEIEELGAGRYSHWESWILFSTTDNTDPNSNGRVYSVREL